MAWFLLSFGSVSDGQPGVPELPDEVVDPEDVLLDVPPVEDVDDEEDVEDVELVAVSTSWVSAPEHEASMIEPATAATNRTWWASERRMGLPFHALPRENARTPSS